MEQIPLSAIPREGVGKGVNRKLRAAGQIPAVLYGAGQAAQSLSLAAADLDKVLKQVSGESAFLALNLGQGAPRMAVLKNLQRDYLGKKVLHADFLEVKADQKLVLEVPIEYVGEAKGVTLGGGVLNIAHHSVRLEGLVSALPELVRVDVSGLELGGAIYLADLALPAGVTAVFDENDAVVTCAEPSSGPAAAPSEEAAGEA
ncbi:MAG: 50S ribosomal protein L25 [Thermodesulfobacteriota bacterium]